MDKYSFHRYTQFNLCFSVCQSVSLPASPPSFSLSLSLSLSLFSLSLSLSVALTLSFNVHHDFHLLNLCYSELYLYQFLYLSNSFSIRFLTLFFLSFFLFTCMILKDFSQPVFLCSKHGLYRHLEPFIIGTTILLLNATMLHFSYSKASTASLNLSRSGTSNQQPLKLFFLCHSTEQFS